PVCRRKDPAKIALYYTTGTALLSRKRLLFPLESATILWKLKQARYQAYEYKRSVRAAPPVAGGEKRREAHLRLLRQRQRGDCRRPGRAPVSHAPGGGGAIFCL